MQVNVRKAKDQFIRSLPVEESLVRPEILESWNRSRGFGLEPGQADKSILSPAALKARITRRITFYDIAVPFMESLYTFTTGSGYLTVISDEEGYVLKAVGDTDIMRLAKDNALVEGCNRSERRIGTNAIGTPLETGVPIQVFGQEHYFNLHMDWVCSGAPIFGPDGGIFGVFCIIGRYHEVSFHTLGMAAAAAEAITKQLRMKSAYDILDKTRKNLHAIIEHMPSGLLLLDQSLVIKQANRKAERLLGLPKNSLMDRSFPEIFGEDAIEEKLLRAGVSDRYVAFHNRGREYTVSLTIIPASSGEYVVTFELAESLHKKVNKIVGAGARFEFHDIIGTSHALQSTIAVAKIVAQNNSNVLLIGESGTGKELFAQSIHNASTRSDGPFVAINCGALPKSMIESELFGYEGGSFTGAKKDGYTGKFELADGGTIFLDEIGDMPFDVQVSLLRVLQNREIVRIGSTKTVKIDVRIIAATNQNLQRAVENNEFRSDLYYRLNVFSIRVPPLRDRMEDVRLLADYFLLKYAGDSGNRVLGFTEKALAALDGYRWPGNVRQLENAVERAVYLTGEGWIDAESLPDIVTAESAAAASASLPSAGASVRVTLPDHNALSLKKNEQRQIEDAIRTTGGNVKKAAEMLGISRRTLYRKLEKYGINPESVRSMP